MRNRLCFLAACLSFAIMAATVYAEPARVAITGVAVNADSCKVTYQPVPGACDYRVYSPDAPQEVKYAGVAHLVAPNATHSFVVDARGIPVYPYKVVDTWPKNGTYPYINVPSLEIEWNGMTPGKRTRLVVEALDRLGPVPKLSLANDDNQLKFAVPTGTLTPMDMLGSNGGMTPDGRYSVNGQGPWDAVPKVIATSQVFVVTATGKPTLPSSPSATSVVFDQFGSGSISPLSVISPSDGTATAVMHTDSVWDMTYQGADVVASRPFLMHRHFMDILYDGATLGHGPTHTSHGSFAMSPQLYPDLSGGRILHVTMEVDAHMHGRRWMGFNIAPEDDPIANFYEFVGNINKSDHALFIEMFPEYLRTTVFTGHDRDQPKSYLATGFYPPSPGIHAPLPENSATGFQVGRGLDDRSRFDLFLSNTHMAFYMDGQKVVERDWVKPLGYGRVRVYFTHYLYHSANFVAEATLYAPWETYWLTKFPYSDERHWDNMGFEILPADSNWTSFAELSAIPRFNAPAVDGQAVSSSPFSTLAQSPQ